MSAAYIPPPLRDRKRAEKANTTAKEGFVVESASPKTDDSISHAVGGEFLPISSDLYSSRLKGELPTPETREWRDIDEHPHLFTRAEIAKRLADVEAKLRHKLLDLITVSEFPAHLMDQMPKLDERAIESRFLFLQRGRDSSSKEIGQLVLRKLRDMRGLAEWQQPKPNSEAAKLIEKLEGEVHQRYVVCERLCKHLSKPAQMEDLFPWKKGHEDIGQNVEQEILRQICHNGKFAGTAAKAHSGQKAAKRRSRDVLYEEEEDDAGRLSDNS